MLKGTVCQAAGLAVDSGCDWLVEFETVRKTGLAVDLTAGGHSIKFKAPGLHSVVFYATIVEVTGGNVIVQRKRDGVADKADGPEFFTRWLRTSSKTGTRRRAKFPGIFTMAWANKRR